MTFRDRGMLTAAWLTAATLAAVLQQDVSAETVLITGANSGLGLEFTKQYAAKGWTVIATHRRREIPPVARRSRREVSEGARRDARCHQRRAGAALAARLADCRSTC